MHQETQAGRSRREEGGWGPRAQKQGGTRNQNRPLVGGFGREPRSRGWAWGFGRRGPQRSKGDWKLALISFLSGVPTLTQEPSVHIF